MWCIKYPVGCARLKSRAQFLVGVSVTMRVEGAIEMYLDELSPMSLAISTLSKVQFISSNLYPGI